VSTRSAQADEMENVSPVNDRIPPSRTRILVWEVFNSSQTDTAHNLQVDPKSYKLPKWHGNISRDSLHRHPRDFLESCNFLSSLKDEGQEAAFEKRFAEFIFDSNAIENAGLDFSGTLRLVRQVLNGENVEADEAYIAAYSPQDDWNCCRRREVIQHVQAFLYLKNQLATTDLTEDILLETHRILMRGILSDSGYDLYQGKYRVCELEVGKPLYTKLGELRELAGPATIPAKMGVWISAYKHWYHNSKDPISDACRLKIDFLTIHPFLDGNGRMSRMLLNAFITNRFPHMLVTYGTSSKERHRYIGSVREAIRTNNHGVFAFYTLRQAAKSVEAQLENLPSQVKVLHTDQVNSLKANIAGLTIRSTTKKARKALALDKLILQQSEV
jgi:Fic family protein